MMGQKQGPFLHCCYREINHGPFNMLFLISCRNFAFVLSPFSSLNSIQTSVDVECVELDFGEFKMY